MYDVVRRLPENMRTDIEQELRSNIEDMLPENPGDGEVERVLTELGSPSKLAVQYDPHPRYLVSPEMFSDYLMVLKIVAIALSSLLAALVVFRFIFGNIGSGDIMETVVEAVSGFVSGAWSGIIHAFFWVTVAFFCIEYFGSRKGLDKWTPKSLPDIPVNQKAIIKRSEVIANAVFSVLFSILFLVGTLRRPQFIAWYEAGKPAAPFFNAAIVQKFLPFFIFMMAFLLFVTALKLYKGRWSVTIAIFQIFYSILSASAGILFITKADVITEAFILRFAEKVDVTVAAMSGYVDTGVRAAAVLIAIGTIIDIVSAIIKTVKAYR